MCLSKSYSKIVAKSNLVWNVQEIAGRSLITSAPCSVIRFWSNQKRMPLPNMMFAVLIALVVLRGANGNCGCTGTGPGSEGLSRGLPVTYGTSCAAWDDGDCSQHACGTLQQCNELYPDTTAGLWCCRPWCYVSSSCTLNDVQPTTVGTNALYYSYQACSVDVTYNDTTCPWQQDVSFEEAAAAILVAEKIGDLFAQSAAVNLVVATTVDNQEVAIVANKAPALSLYALRAYGGEHVFSTSLLSAPVYSLTASSDWVASASEGSSLHNITIIHYHYFYHNQILK